MREGGLGPWLGQPQLDVFTADACLLLGQPQHDEAREEPNRFWRVHLPVGRGGSVSATQQELLLRAAGEYRVVGRQGVAVGVRESRHLAELARGAARAREGSEHVVGGAEDLYVSGHVACVSRPGEVCRDGASTALGGAPGRGTDFRSEGGGVVWKSKRTVDAAVVRSRKASKQLGRRGLQLGALEVWNRGETGEMQGDAGKKERRGLQLGARQ